MAESIEFVMTYDGWRIACDDDKSAAILARFDIPDHPSGGHDGMDEREWFNEILYTLPEAGIAIIFPATRPLPEPPTVGNRCI